MLIWHLRIKMNIGLMVTSHLNVYHKFAIAPYLTKNEVKPQVTVY